MKINSKKLLIAGAALFAIGVVLKMMSMMGAVAVTIAGSALLVIGLGGLILQSLKK